MPSLCEMFLLSLFFITGSGASIPDGLCYLLSPNTNAREVLRLLTAPTERACHEACFSTDKCFCVFYDYPSCALLGAPNDVTCSETEQMQAIRCLSSSCPKRVDALAEMGADQCVSRFEPGVMVIGTSGVCPPGSPGYVIRGITEEGERISIDNDRVNVLSFDTIRNLWVVEYAPTGFHQFLVAVGCGVPRDGACSCPELPLAVETASAATIGTLGACGATSKRLTFDFGKADGVYLNTLSVADTAKMQISCQAGIWILDLQDKSNGWSIEKASCDL